MCGIYTSIVRDLLEPKEQDHSYHQAADGEAEPHLGSDGQRLVFWWGAGGAHEEGKAGEVVALADCGAVTAGLHISLTVLSQPAVITTRVIADIILLLFFILDNLLGVG